MVLTSSERDDLVARVERTLGRAHERARPRASVSRAAIRAAVDRTLGTVPSVTDGAAPVVAGEGTAVLAAISMPDLASRTRGALVASGVGISELGSATEGRSTVVAVRLPLAAAEQVRGAAESIGARFSWRGEGR